MGSANSDLTEKFSAQLETLKNYRESLDRVQAELDQKAQKLCVMEEQYNRMAGVFGVSYLFYLYIILFFIKFIWFLIVHSHYF